MSDLPDYKESLEDLYLWSIAGDVYNNEVNLEARAIVEDAFAQLSKKIEQLEERIRLDDIRFKGIIKRADKGAIELHDLKNQKPISIEEQFDEALRLLESMRTEMGMDEAEFFIGFHDVYPKQPGLGLTCPDFETLKLIRDTYKKERIEAHDTKNEYR